MSNLFSIFIFICFLYSRSMSQRKPNYKMDICLLLSNLLPELINRNNNDWQLIWESINLQDISNNFVTSYGSCQLNKHLLDYVCIQAMSSTLSASWTHGLIAQSVRASEWNSVIVGSNPTQAKCQYHMCQIIPLHSRDYLKKT